MTLLKSCLRWIVYYLLVAALFSALVYIRFPQPRVALIGGGAAALFVWFSIGYLNSLRERKAEKRMIRSGMTAEHPEDGEKIAAIGAVRSMESLEAPISKRRCVAYEYSMSASQGEDTNNVYSGFALVPSTIETPRGSIRLLAVPELDFPDEHFGGPQHRTNAAEYVGSTTFRQHEGIDIKREIKHMKEVVADDDGRIRYDIQHQKNADPSRLDYSEKILAPGDRVVAIGRYSTARGGLVPDSTALLHAVKITRGDGDEVLRKLASKDRTDRVMSCGCLIPVIVAALVGLAVVPLAAIEQIFPDKDPSWIEVRVERWVHKNIRPFIKGDEYVAIQLERGQARGKLTWQGSTVPLTAAAAHREGNWLVLTFRGEGNGATARFLGGRLESLQIANDIVPASEVELDQFATTAEEVSGRITYLGPRAGPHLRVAFRATVPPASP